MSRAIFLDDAHKLNAKRLNAAFLLFSLVVMAAVFMGCAFLYGKYEGRQEMKAEMDAAPKLTRMPVVQGSLQVPEGECREIQKLRERLGRVRAKG